MIRNPDIGDALSALRPNCEYMLEGENYSTITWLDENQTLPTEQEVLEKLEELKKERPFVLLRKERNRLISETDWTQLKDIDLDIIRERNWKNYRQALRDLPAKSNPKLDNDGDLDFSSITWPDKPSS